MKKIPRWCAWSQMKNLVSGTKKRLDFLPALENSVAKGGTTSWTQGLDAVVFHQAKNGSSFCTRYVVEISGLRSQNIYPVAPTTRYRTSGMSSWISWMTFICIRPPSSSQFSSAKSDKVTYLLIHIRWIRRRIQATILAKVCLIISFWRLDMMSRSNLEKTWRKKSTICLKTPLNKKMTASLRRYLKR